MQRYSDNSTFKLSTWQGSLRFTFHLFLFFVLVAVIAGCAQTKQYTPEPIRAEYSLSNIPYNIVRINVNDLRAERDNSDELKNVIKDQIFKALSKDGITGKSIIYILNIDIIEHRAFFTFGNWNASTKLRIRLMSQNNEILGNWTAEGNAHRSNMLGYATAKAVSQDAYNIAIADMMSTLSSLSLVNR